MPIIFKDIAVRNNKVYKIRIYPDPEDHTEALKLLINARQLFFGIAEDGIGVPPYLFADDNKETLITGGTTIATRLQVAELAIQMRERVLAEMKDNEFAKAKLAGAYVNKMGVVADDTLDWYIKKMAAKKAMETAEDAPARAIAQQQYSLYEANENAGKHELDDLHMHKVLPLLKYVRLKGRKADIDEVLGAQLGEVTKAAVAKNFFVHDGENIKTAEAMYEVDTLTDWMLSLAKQNPRLKPCEDLITHLAEQARERLNLRREDLEARDKAEVAVYTAIDQITTTVAEIAKPLSGYEAGNVRKAEVNMVNACGVISDMLKQGQKKVSVALVMSIEQLPKMTKILQTLATSLPKPQQAQIIGAVAHLKKISGRHLTWMLNHGEPSKVLIEELDKAMDEVTAAKPSVPSSLTGAGREKYQKTVDAFEEGIKIIEALPGIRPAKLSNGSVINKREAVAARVQHFVVAYDPKQRELL